MKKSDSDRTIDIDMNKKCSKCGDPGAVNNGLCLTCAAKAMTNGHANGDQVKRLLQLLRDLDTLEAQRKDYMTEYRRDRDSLDKVIQKLRVDIETGQKSIFEG